MGAHHDAFINNLLGLQTQLRNFAMMLTSNRDDADDLVQDTTLKVSPLSTRTAPSPWPI